MLVSSLSNGPLGITNWPSSNVSLIKMMRIIFYDFTSIPEIVLDLESLFPDILSKVEDDARLLR